MDVTIKALEDRPTLCIKAGDVLTLHDIDNETAVKLMSEQLHNKIMITAVKE